MMKCALFAAAMLASTAQAGTLDYMSDNTIEAYSPVEADVYAANLPEINNTAVAMAHGNHNAHRNHGALGSDRKVNRKESGSLEKATIGENNAIGPFARLRGGVETAENVDLGNFVEVKKATIGPGSKAKHLSYLGDATLGKDVNISCGTITANYNRKTGVKAQTTFDDGATTGSGTILVAPVAMGEKAYAGAGTVIRKDVPNNALAVCKHEEVVKKDYNV